MKMFSKRLAFLIVGIFLLASFALFSKYVKNGGLKITDFDTTVKLQNKIPSRLDELMDDGAILADAVVSSAMVLLITGWGLSHFKNKRLKILAVPLAFLILTVIEAYGKNFVPHPGPPFFLVKHPTTIFPKFHVIEPYSYPSGHAARVTFLAITIFFLTIYQKKTLITKKVLLGLLPLGYAIFVYVSRIYLGHHWLSDIVGGVFLGAALGFMASAALEYS